MLALALGAYIQLQLYDAPEALWAACGRKVAGCATVEGHVCTVHVLRPAIGRHDDFTVIGHEFWHCYFGGYHGDDG